MVANYHTACKVALLIACVILCPCSARADSGPSAEVHDLHALLPSLISSQLRASGDVLEPRGQASSITIQEVVIKGSDAIVHWTDADFPQFDGIAGLRHSAGRWWYVSSDFGTWPSLPAFGSALALAEDNTSLWIAEHKLGAHRFVNCDGSIEQLQGRLPGLFSPPCGWTDNLYEYVDSFFLRLTFGINRWSLPGVHFSSLYGGRLDTGFCFTTTLDSAQRINASGASIDVWFPYILNPEGRYTLSLAQVSQPVFATVHDNTLHFTLPAFSVEAREALDGEIRMVR